MSYYKNPKEMYTEDFIGNTLGLYTEEGGNFYNLVFPFYMRISYLTQLADEVTHKTNMTDALKYGYSSFVDKRADELGLVRIKSKGNTKINLSQSKQDTASNSRSLEAKANLISNFKDNAIGQNIRNNITDKVLISQDPFKSKVSNKNITRLSPLMEQSEFSVPSIPTSKTVH